MQSPGSHGQPCPWIPRISPDYLANAECQDLASLLPDDSLERKRMTVAFLHDVRKIRTSYYDRSVVSMQIFYQNGGSDTLGQMDIRDEWTKVKIKRFKRNSILTGLVPLYYDDGIGRKIKRFKYISGSRTGTPAPKLKVRS